MLQKLYTQQHRTVFRTFLKTSQVVICPSRQRNLRRETINFDCVEIRVVLISERSNPPQNDSQAKAYMSVGSVLNILLLAFGTPGDMSSF